MMHSTPRRDGLVILKGRPAVVRQVGKTVEVETADGQRLQVRPKDVTLLHPGPLGTAAGLPPLTPGQAGELEVAWELLAGTVTDLAELAELAFGAYTPASAWAAWLALTDGLLFRGTPQELVARPADEVVRERAARAGRAADQEAWSAFTARLQLGQAAPEDRRYLRDLENLALGRRDKSRVLRELGRSETPETAHALLLKLGTWDAWVDPYPHRLGLPVVPADLPLPDLRDEERLDLTGLPALAIDDEGNQEPDDALSLDGRRLWVHVADVAALVHPGSPADLEARARGATLYLPEGSVPMLPPPAVLTLGLGLGPAGRPSPALSFGLDLDDDGLVDAVEVRPSWVQVTRLTYEQAESRLEEEPLRGLWVLARRNRDRRRERGAVEIELPEVKMDVGDGRVTIRPLPPLRSRDLVGEAMLLAGEAASRFGLEHGLALPFTAQDFPTTDERPTDLAGMFGLRQHLRPSEHSLHPGPHAGLGLEVYSQATSPLRRYLDLVVHQQLRAHLRGEPPLTAAEVLERIGAASAAARDVRQAERLARKHWTLVYLTQHPERTWAGIVVEQRGRRSTVLIPELELDVQVVLRGEPALNSVVQLAHPEVRLAELAVHFQVLE